jgi:hypothetical protein
MVQSMEQEMVQKLMVHQTMEQQLLMVQKMEQLMAGSGHEYSNQEMKHQ